MLKYLNLIALVLWVIVFILEAATLIPDHIYIGMMKSFLLVVCYVQLCYYERNGKE